MTTLAPLIPHSRPWIIKEDLARVSSVIKSGMISQGQEVDAFEVDLAKHLLAKNVVATSSGSSALLLGLIAIGINSGHEVILPTYVCTSVLEAVLSVGATPKLCDVNEFGVISQNTVGPLIGPKTGAIIAVHIFGHVCDIEKLKVFNIPVIEDACQSFGLLIKGKHSGTIGDVGALSFHATKCLTTGEGGALVTSDEAIGRRARAIARGTTDLQERIFAPMTNIQAALGRSQLKRYDRFVKKRKEILDIYVDAACTKIGTDLTSNLPFRFTLRTNRNFDTVYNQALNDNVNIRRGVDGLLHRNLGLNDSEFEGAVELFESILSVPFFPGLSRDEVDRVAKLIKNISNDD